MFVSIPVVGLWVKLEYFAEADFGGGGQAQVELAHAQVVAEEDEGGLHRDRLFVVLGL